LAFIQTALLHGWDVPEIERVAAQLAIGQHYAERGSQAASAFARDVQRAQEYVQRDVVGRAQVFTVTSASMYSNPSEGSVPGVRKVRVRFQTGGLNGIAPYVESWIPVPDPWRPNAGRWIAFTSAVGVYASPNDDLEPFVCALHGKHVRVLLHDGMPVRISRFLPACANVA
jgi:hypothetical protein